MRVVRTARTAGKAIKLIIPSVVLIGSMASGFLIKEYKTSMISKRNQQTASMAKAVSSEISKRELEKKQLLSLEKQKENEKKIEAFKKEFDDFETNSQKDFDDFSEKVDESYEQFMEKASENREAAFNGDYSFGDQFDGFFDQENEQEVTSEAVEEKTEEPTEAPEETVVVEMPDEYYVFGTVDSSGCYADAGVLYDERERLYSVDASDKSYSWAVFVKNGKAVEAWCSPDTLTEAELVPYTEKEQLKQYGSIKGGSADNVTGYWHTTF